MLQRILRQNTVCSVENIWKKSLCWSPRVIIQCKSSGVVCSSYKSMASICLRTSECHKTCLHAVRYAWKQKGVKCSKSCNKTGKFLSRFFIVISDEVLFEYMGGGASEGNPGQSLLHCCHRERCFSLSWYILFHDFLSLFPWYGKFCIFMIKFVYVFR
jgi:hypothetical protein